jgi:hypothetical protein
MRTGQEDAQFAVNLLKQLADNLEVAIEIVIERVDGISRDDPAQLRSFAAYVRLTFSWIALSLCKIEDLWSLYGKMASADSTQRMKTVVREVSRRKVRNFRDSEVAHLLSRETSNPWTPTELMHHAMVMMDGDMEAFLVWLKPRPNRDPAGTVIHTLLQFRSDILEKYPDVEVTA